MVGDDFDQNMIETVQTAYNDFLSYNGLVCGVVWWCVCMIFYPLMDWCVCDC